MLMIINSPKITTHAAICTAKSTRLLRRRKAYFTSAMVCLASLAIQCGHFRIVCFILRFPNSGRQNNNSGLPARISGRKLFLRKNMIFSHRGYLTTIPLYVLLYKFRTS